MRSCPRATPGVWPERGEWMLTWLGEDTWQVRLRCPGCGTTASLEDHEIADDGTVTPSLVCQNEGCGFHENVQLSGWEPPVVEGTPASGWGR